MRMLTIRCLDITEPCFFIEITVSDLTLNSSALFDAHHPWRAPYGRTEVRPILFQTELCVFVMCMDAQTPSGDAKNAVPRAVPLGLLPHGTLAHPCASQDAVQGRTNAARDRMSTAAAQERPVKNDLS